MVISLPMRAVAGATDHANVIVVSRDDRILQIMARPDCADRDRPAVHADTSFETNVNRANTRHSDRLEEESVVTKQSTVHSTATGSVSIVCGHVGASYSSIRGSIRASIVWNQS